MIITKVMLISVNIDANYEFKTKSPSMNQKTRKQLFENDELLTIIFLNVCFVKYNLIKIGLDRSVCYS